MLKSSIILILICMVMSGIAMATAGKLYVVSADVWAEYILFINLYHLFILGYVLHMEEMRKK